MYLYAAAALAVESRLSMRAPPRTVTAAILLGIAVPACGCTALPLARRSLPAPGASFLAAAYAANPLLVLAAGALGGLAAAGAVLALSLLAALAAAVILPGVQRPAPRPRSTLADYLLKRDANPLADAAPYARRFGPPALALGGAVGLAAGTAPYAGAALVALLALLFAPPRQDVARDHGDAYAGRLYAIAGAFALAAGVATGVLA